MILLKNSQTNWKYILIVIILALFVGGGILCYWRIVTQEFPLAEFPQVKKIEKIELSEEILNKIINETFPPEYAKSWAEYLEVYKGLGGSYHDSPYYREDDLNNDGRPEIIITVRAGSPTEWVANKAYLAIFTILDNKGNYGKVVDFEFSQENELTFAAPPEIILIKDINNDGLIEMQLNWGVGAVRPFTTDAFLVLDWSHQKIDWLRILDKEGNIVPAIFNTGWGGSSGGFWAGSIYTIDVNKDGKLEIVELSQKSSQNIYAPDLELKVERWEAKVYEWNGSIFSYNKELSISGTGSEIPEWLKILCPPFPF